MDDIPIIKSCKNCAYYRAHYAKDDNGVYCELEKGHCSHKQIGKMPFSRIFRAGSACSLWIMTTDIKQSESLYQTVNKTANRVKQLAAHLDFKFDDE